MGDARRREERVPYERKKDRRRYNFTLLFYLGKHKKIWKTIVADHVRKSTNNESCTERSEDVMVGDERVRLDVVDEAIKEEARNVDEDGVRDVECIGEHRYKRKGRIHEMCDFQTRLKISPKTVWPNIL